MYTKVANDVNTTIHVLCSRSAENGQLKRLSDGRDFDEFGGTQPR